MIFSSPPPEPVYGSVSTAELLGSHKPRTPVNGAPPDLSAALGLKEHVEPGKCAAPSTLSAQT